MSATRPRVFITDCEGPITKNDNAAELAEAFIPKGDRFFAKISLYDDYLAEVIHKPEYKAGDTLRLILPFFAAFGLDNRNMLKFSRRNILIIPHADKALRTLMKKMPAFIVSTSYSQYISAVCDVIGFPFANTYSTLVDLDEFELPEGERSTLKELHRVIMELPDFSLPPGAQSANDLDPAAGKTVQKLDEIFWHVLPEMAAYRIVSKTNPVGGKEKAAAILKILSLTGSHLEDVIYFGDSITDVDAFRLVKSNGGIAVSFNGNSWAIREADVAVTGTHALPIVWLAELFLDYGRDAFDDLGMCRITPEDIPRVSALSGRIRRNVRTEKIGGLG